MILIFERFDTARFIAIIVLSGMRKTEREVKPLSLLRITLDFDKDVQSTAPYMKVNGGYQKLTISFTQISLNAIDL